MNLQLAPVAYCIELYTHVIPATSLQLCSAYQLSTHKCLVFYCSVINNQQIALGGGGGGEEIGYCAVPDPRHRQEMKGEFINHIIVSSLLRIKLNFNEDMQISIFAFG